MAQFLTFPKPFLPSRVDMFLEYVSENTEHGCNSWHGWFKQWAWILVSLGSWLLTMCCWYVIPGSQAGTHFPFLCSIVLLLICINNMKLCYLDMTKQWAEKTYTTIIRAHKNLIYILVQIIITFHLTCTKKCILRITH